MPSIGWQELSILFFLAFPAIALYAIIRAATRPSRKNSPPAAPAPAFHCPKCSKDISYGAQFCEHCGEELSWEAQSKG